MTTKGKQPAAKKTISKTRLLELIKELNWRSVRAAWAMARTLSRSVSGIAEAVATLLFSPGPSPLQEPQ